MKWATIHPTERMVSYILQICTKCMSETNEEVKQRKMQMKRRFKRRGYSNFTLKLNLYTITLLRSTSLQYEQIENMILQAMF